MKKINLQSKFLQPMAILTSGSILAQLITFVFSPIMTRLFTPEQIGEYTLLVTAVSMFGHVVALRYDVAIVLEKEQKNIFPLIKLSSVLTFACSLLIAIGYMISYAVDGQSIGSVLYKSFFIFLLLLLTGVTNILVSYNNRCKEYKLITKVHVKRNLAKECVMVVGGLVYPHSIALAVSQVVGTIWGVKEQSKTLYRASGKFTDIINVPFDKCKETAIRYKNQPLFSTPAIFASNYSYSSINIFIESLFGAATLGFYSISYRILGIPLGLISNNISKVYFREAANQYNQNGNYRKLFLKTSALLFLIAIPFAAVLILLAPRVCVLVYGEKYYLAGIYIRCLAPMFGIRLIVSPLTVGMQISEKQQKELVIQVMFIIASVCGYIVARVAGLTTTMYLVFISVTFTVIYLAYYAYLFKISKRNV